MSGTSFGNKDFTDEERIEIQNLLESKISADNLATRPGAGGCMHLVLIIYEINNYNQRRLRMWRVGKPLSWQTVSLDLVAGVVILLH